MIDKFIFQRAPLLYSVSENIDKMQSGTVCTLGTSAKNQIVPPPVLSGRCVSPTYVLQHTDTPCGGQRWIRTIESLANGFTVRPF